MWKVERRPQNDPSPGTRDLFEGDSLLEERHQIGFSHKMVPVGVIVGFLIEMAACVASYIRAFTAKPSLVEAGMTVIRLIRGPISLLRSEADQAKRTAALS
jgi:hypothetical protein